MDANIGGIYQANPEPPKKRRRVQRGDPSLN
jgi:hypothetical protein